MSSYGYENNKMELTFPFFIKLQRSQKYAYFTFEFDKNVKYKRFLCFISSKIIPGLDQGLLPGHDGPLAVKNCVLPKIIKHNSHLKCCDAKRDNTMNEISLALNSYSMTRFKVTHL